MEYMEEPHMTSIHRGKPTQNKEDRNSTNTMTTSLLPPPTGRTPPAFYSRFPCPPPVLLPLLLWISHCLPPDAPSSSCLYSPWSPWSSCSSSSCDEGVRMRQRMLKLHMDTGATCSHTQDFQRCTAPGCSQVEDSCMMSEWISWSSCSTSCGVGRRSRERFVKQYPEDGTQCQQNTEETEECVVNQHCSPSSCVVTEWTEFGPCSATCGSGTRIRERMMKMPPLDGSVCNSLLTEVEKCMMGDCPVDCMVSDWSNWAECNKSCGRGHTVRTRMIKLEPEFGGQVCPETVQTKRCKMGKCRSKTNMETRGGGRRRRGKQGRDAAAAEPGKTVNKL